MRRLHKGKALGVGRGGGGKDGRHSNDVEFVATAEVLQVKLSLQAVKTLGSAHSKRHLATARGSERSR